jgi:aspartate aminotransferase-like enzyme
MKKFYLITPGPTPIPPEVAAQSALPIIHHRTHEFGDLFDQVSQGLKYVFQTKNDVFILTASGSGAMESAVANLVNPGDKVIVATSGSFGDRWVKIAQAFGAKVISVQEEWGKPVNPQKIQDALVNHSDIQAVFLQHTETSTGVVNDLKTIGAIVSKTNAVSVVDAISGLAGEELQMDEWNLDVVVSGSQKGLMTAPGLAFASVGEKAWKKVEACKNHRFYFDYRLIKKSIPNKETPWTPAVTLLQSLNTALQLIREDGMEKTWERHKKLARATQAGLKALGLTLFAESPCAVLTSAKLPSGLDGAKLVDWMRDELGVSIAGGQDHLKGKIVRLAHMGYMDQFDILIGLSALETALRKFGVSVPSGQAIHAVQETFAVHG